MIANSPRGISATNRLARVRVPTAAGESASVGALLADSPAAVGTLTLASLLVALIPRGELAIIVSTHTMIANSPMPSTGSANYKVDFDLGCGAAAGLTV